MTKDALSRLAWWLRDHWKVILLILGLTAIAAAFGFWKTRNAQMPAIEEHGEIVRFGSYSDEMGAIPVVLVRIGDGRILQLRVHRSMTQYCRVGSSIRLVRRGDILRVHASGCSPPQP